MKRNAFLQKILFYFLQPLQHKSVMRLCSSEILRNNTEQKDKRYSSANRELLSVKQRPVGCSALITTHPVDYRPGSKGSIFQNPDASGINLTHHRWLLTI